MDTYEALNKKECANLFIEIVWYNPNWNGIATELAKKLRMICENVTTYQDWDKCLSYLQEAETSIQFIISEIRIEDIQTLFKQTRSISNIYVYSGEGENQTTSLLNDEFKIFNFIHTLDNLLSTIHKNILIIDFPKLERIQDKLNYISPSHPDDDTLQRFVKFTKMKLRSNKDYQIYPEKKIKSFIKDHSKYSTRNMLRWYANDSFFRRILNVPQSSLSKYASRSIRVGLYEAVKDQSKAQETKYSGILYSETTIDDNLWKSIQKNVGKDIVIDSFLPASKNKNYSIHFNKQNMVYITIILPGFRGKWQNDFIDLVEFSDDHNRQEILFNALSEFRILEANILESERHLILLYEANTFRKFIRLNQTTFSFIKDPSNLKCNVCGSNISNNALVHIQLLSFDNICENCLWKYQSDNKYPLLRTTPSNLENEKSFEGYFYVEIPGILMKYDKLSKLPFYGYKCVKCNITGSSYYTCLKCLPPSLSSSQENKELDFDYSFYEYEYYNCLKYPKTITTICEKCASQICFEENHSLILENYPYTFWSESISEKEYNELKAFKDKDSEDHLSNFSEERKNIVDEEIDMADSMDKLVKLMILEIVWYDPDCEKKKEDYKNKLGNLVDKVNIKFYNKASEALGYIRKVENFVQVIVSGNFFKRFVQDVCNIKNVSCIYILGKKSNKENQDLICNKISFYENYQSIKSKVEKNVRRLEFPMFCLLSDVRNRMKMLQMHDFLNSTKFRNEEKCKEYFLNLARKIYFQSNKDTEEIKVFQNKYNYWDGDPLHWYTKETFLYKLVNNCLRLATFESAQLSKYFVEDLKEAIKKRYLEQDRSYNGLLFRASYISDNEWALLEKNIGKDIEMFGFLSTTRDINVAKNFIAGTSRALMTIIVPPIFEKGNQGFADLEKGSKFAGEKEILFNIMSRFTILEAMKNDDFQGKKFPRHLVLLYASEELKLSAALKQDLLKIRIIEKELIKCRFCNNQMKQNSEDLFYASLDWGSHENNSYICHKCIIKLKNFHTAPLVYINPSICGSTIKIKGFSMKYTKSLGIPFYGYRCSKCDKKNLDVEFYKCLKCKELQWCRNCFLKENSCLENPQHIIVLETQPYSFWTQKMTQSQIYQYEYEADQMKSSYDKEFFPIPRMLFENEEYEQCLKLYHQYLRKSESVNDEKTANLCKSLAETYMNLERFDEAEKWCRKSKKISIKIKDNHLGNHEWNLLQEINLLLANIKYKSGKYQEVIRICSKIIAEPDKCPSAQSVYEMIGLAYEMLGNLEAALENHLKCLQGPVKVHSFIARVYNNLGSIYHKMGKYQDALTNHQESLKCFTCLYGDEHFQTASVYEKLGHDFHMLEDYMKAIVYHSEALRIRKLISEEIDKDLDISLSYENIGLAFYALKAYDEAVENYLQALKIRTSLVGEVHSDIASLFEHLGMAYYGLEEYEKTIEFCLNSLSIKKSLNKENYFSPEKLYAHIGLAYSKLENHEEAIKFLSKAILIGRYTDSSLKDLDRIMNPETSFDYEVVGSFYYDFGKYGDAFENYLKSLKMRRSLYGDEHPDTASSYENLGKACYGLKRYYDAIEFCNKSLNLKILIYGEDHHPSTQNSYVVIGLGYLGLEKYLEAREFLSKAFDLMISNEIDKDTVINLATLLILAIKLNE